MTRPFYNHLKSCLHKDVQVEIDRSPLDDQNVQGYVVGVTESLITIHECDDHFFLNGYSIFPIDSIEQFRELDNEESAAHRAVVARGGRPGAPAGVDTASFVSALRTVHENQPLVTIHLERVDNEVCYIGRVQRVTDKELTLLEIDPAGEFCDEETYALTDITKIDFGAAYERALWLVNCVESGDPELIAEARRLDGLA